MSELMAFESERIYWAVEQVERVVGDIDNLHLDDNLFCLKSEADKVIEELEYKLDLYKRGWAENDKVIAYLCKELRHQKYKRCMAMAKLCRARYNEWAAYYPTTTTRKMRFLYKWEKRWLKIAEQFKEAK